MRLASKLLVLVLVLLALPMGSAFAAGVSTPLTISIVVTVSSTVGMEFCKTDGTAEGLTEGQTWNLSIALGGSSANPSTIYTDVLNDGAMAVNVSVLGSHSGTGSWTIASTPANDKFEIAYGPTASEVSIDTAQSAGIVAAGGHTTGTGITFYAPTTVDSMAPGTITVTYTATAIP